MEKRRLKGIVVSQRDILCAYLIQGARLPDNVLIQEIGNVPADAEIRSVFYAPDRQAFVFVVEHPSFPMVPAGSEIPMFCDPSQIKTRALKIDKRPDWRIGLSVKPKFRNHPHFGQTGEVIEVLPDGTDGIKDKDQVLKVLMNVSGAIILGGADEFINA